MTLEEFKQSIEQDSSPPSQLSPALKALWHQGRGDWDKAHDFCQDGYPEIDWVHAHLHRVEGDLSNAGYWYSRAGKPPAEASTDDEFDQMAQTLLEKA